MVYLLEVPQIRGIKIMENAIYAPNKGYIMLKIKIYAPNKGYIIDICP